MHRRLSRRSILGALGGLGASALLMRLPHQSRAATSIPDYPPMTASANGLLLLSSEAPVPESFEGRPVATRRFPATASALGPLSRSDAFSAPQSLAQQTQLPTYELRPTPDGLVASGGIATYHADGTLESAAVGYGRVGERTSCLTILVQPYWTDGLIPVRAAGTPREPPTLPMPTNLLPQPGAVVTGGGAVTAYWRDGSLLYVMTAREDDVAGASGALISQLARVGPKP